MRVPGSSLRRGLAAAVAAASMLAVGAAAAAAQTGGAAAPAEVAPVAPTAGLATLMPDGSAVAPTDAPRQVRKAINAANRIRFMPYTFGGGHRKFKAAGYDCSGAVSYVLHAAGMLKRPLASGPLARSWGAPGFGRWITVYANRGHAYAVIAGLRWDTSAVGEPLNSGSGPRWRTTARAATGYTPKYYPGF